MPQQSITLTTTPKTQLAGPLKGLLVTRTAALRGVQSLAFPSGTYSSFVLLPPPPSPDAVYQ